MGSSFSMEGGGMSPEKRCAICIEDGPKEIVNNEGQVEQVQQVQICPTGHYAHLSCITDWYAISDICPECRNKVRDFPLWQDINPPEPGYDFSDPEQLIRVNRNFMIMREEDHYDTAHEYFYSDEGEAYVKYLIDEDMIKYNYSINVDEEDPENVDIDSLMYSIVRERQLNVADALYDYAQRNDLLEDLKQSSGAIINKFVDNFNYDRDQDILFWLWYRGFDVGFGFLENAALEANNADAVQWYLIHVKPSVYDEQLIELFDTVRSDMMDEQNDIYALLQRYFTMNTQVQTAGGMWQRGGFFMTCS